MKITINSTPTENDAVPTALRKLADEYIDWAWQSAWAIITHQNAAEQLRFVADQIEAGKADADTGLLFWTAGRRLLAQLKAARMDVVHESRASRRAPQIIKPSDTPAAKRAFARERGK